MRLISTQNVDKIKWWTVPEDVQYSTIAVGYDRTELHHCKLPLIPQEFIATKYYIHDEIRMWKICGSNAFQITNLRLAINSHYHRHRKLFKTGGLVYVIGWGAVVFGINCASNAGKKL